MSYFQESSGGGAKGKDGGGTGKKNKSGGGSSGSSGSSNNHKSKAWFPDGYIQSFRSYVFCPLCLKDYGSAILRCII